MSFETLVAPTKVLAIASHVVYGYVGNTIVVFIMQVLGCEVAALNTVEFSNHTGYGQFKGTKSSAQEILDIYDGLKQNHLTDFDVLLSGYAPSAAAVEAIGSIARDLKLQATTKPGSFFWVLDPVMGDDGQIYVDKDVVPVYKNLLRDADLIVPNQFEAELLSESKITSMASLTAAIVKLHQTHRIPHIIVTSVRFSSASPTLSVVGSTARSDGSPRLFRIEFPAIDCPFTGTGDMFGALTVVRLRAAVAARGLGATKSWVSPDEVEPVELPLAHAVELVVASMHAVLLKTKTARDEALDGMRAEMELERGGEKRLRLRTIKATEVRLVGNLADLMEPKVSWKVKGLKIGGGQGDENEGESGEEEGESGEEKGEDR